MKISILNSHPQLNNLDIQELERKINAVLPNEYRAFLLQNNGGKPEPFAFPLPENLVDTHALVDWFYCINDGDIDDLASVIDTMKNRIPAGFLPIATDPGGNQICIQLLGVNRGKIYFWNHEEEPFQGTQDYSGTLLVADSFDEFLDSFIPLPQ